MSELVHRKMPKELRHAMASMGPQFKLALPSHISPERFTRIVFTAVQRNPRLLDASQESVLASVMRAAEQGLMPDGRQGALVPYYNKKNHALEAQWIPMWQGLLDLARQSGAIDDAYVASVRERDEFEYELGFDRTLIHKPALKDRGEILFVYAVILLANGAKTFGPGPMTVDEVNVIRGRSKTQTSGPWVTDWEAMAWKTVLKRALKYVPQSPELQQAIEEDNAAEFGQWEEPGRQTAKRTIENLQAPAEETQEVKNAVLTPDGYKVVAQPERAIPEWPKQRADGVWVDKKGMAYNAEIHASYQGPHPTVNSDGTFRMRKGCAAAYHAAYKNLETTEKAPEEAEVLPPHDPDEQDRILDEVLGKIATAQTTEDWQAVEAQTAPLVGMWLEKARQAYNECIQSSNAEVVDAALDAVATQDDEEAPK